MIINGKEEDVKCNIYLEEGEKDLEYKSSYVYLGVIITDNGNLRYDLEAYIDNKRSNVTIKYNNLIRKHVNMPMKFKLQVLDSCVCSVLIYACETWGITNVQSLETSYRFGLKRALSVRDSTCNEIVYIETGRSSLCARISKQQLSFWKKLGAYIDENPNHPLKSLIEQGERNNISFLNHYRDLERTYTSPDECQKSIVSTFTEELKTKIRQASEADQSRS